ncbi:MAG: O-acetyl-ADP-ribose deacetylase [Oscillospiraceae bacterium]|nr:O-acetyl-ADP-ribose deacetylase [Oscillospiraceae bacterium]
MPLQIIRNDITKMKVDAIVNAAKNSLLGGGGVDGAIHDAAGAGLLEECKTLGGCETGKAKITGAYNLPCRHVIHTVGPIYRDGCHGEPKLLSSCYRESLKLAKEAGCETVAFPLISSGVYGYPKAEALRIAVDTISEFLSDNDMTVYIVIFDRKAYQIGEKLFADIEAFIDDNYVDSHSDDRYERRRRMSLIRHDDDFDGNIPACPPPMLGSAPMEKPVMMQKAAVVSLDDAVKQIDESFSEMLLRKIDESGLTDAQVYKKANIDRKLFSKIRSDKNYKPSKPTVIAFSIALELSLEETKDMLMKAGFALSHSSKFDIIIEFFISRGNYNIFEINEALFAFDQSLLGV